MLNALEKAALHGPGSLGSEETDQVRLALSAGRFGNWQMNFEPPRLECSAQCKADFGLAADAPFDYPDFRAAVHPDDLPRVETALAEAIARLGDYEAEYRCLWPDGTTHWINTRARVLGEGGRPVRMVGVTLDVTERKQAEHDLRISESRLAGQKAALELLVSGAPIEGVLQRLVQTAHQQVGRACRVSLLVADREGGQLRFGASIGLDESYARGVDGLAIAADSPSCGSAAHTGACVVVPEIADDPLWRPYLDFANQHGIRSVWSFPIGGFDGGVLGTLAVYPTTPGEPLPSDLESLELIVRTAALILQQYRTAQERREARAELERNRSQLEADLADAKLLQHLSAALIHGDNERDLYQALVDVAATISRSNFASLQMVCPGDGPAELILLASRGLGHDEQQLFDHVVLTESSANGQAYKRVARVIVPDVDACTFLAPERLAICHKVGFRSLQATPLLSRAGEVIGMIGTHWRDLHVPSERELRLLDILARQAADLIERQTSAETSRASEERYRSLAAVTTDVLWTTDGNGDFVAPQPAWTEYTGQTFEDLRGSGWAQAIHPDDRDRVQREWLESVASCKPHYSEARLWNARAGAYRHTISRGTPVFRADGTVREWVGSDSDVHDEKQLAESLQEASRRKDEFLATLAHELRNPLAPLRNGLQIVKRAPHDVAKVDRALAMMDRQLNQLVRLIDDLLDVSRFSLGKVALRRERVRLGDVLQQAVETCSPLVTEAGQTLTLNIADYSVMVLADPTRLAQVFINLLNNAIKFTPRGGRIDVHVENDDGQARVAVRDEGLGIEPAKLAHIFELFTQLDSSLEKAHGGLGIGLSLARWLVEMHGGRIEAHSEGLHKGSRFSVCLPVSTDDANVMPEAREPTRGLATSHRILVVDDNRDAATSLATLLELQGHSAVTAGSGMEALRLADERPPDLILLDLGMPHMSGYDVALQVRERGWGRHVLLVALTGWGQEQDRRRSQEAGFDYHLVKPVDLAELDRVMSRLLPTQAERARPETMRPFT
jgi:PAS domain S-box-containing protein